MANWNDSIIEQFRANGGTGVRHFGNRLLLLTTKGAKTGRPNTSPVAYHLDGNRYVVAATKSGAPTHPAWYHNLVAHPEATIEVRRDKFQVRATPLARGPERDRLYEQHARLMPDLGFPDYPKKTKRVIPVVVLERL